jgi:cell division protein FtsA
VKRASLEMDEMILEPLASAEAVLSQEEKEAGVVLVDIGGGTTDVAIFYEDIIRHTAVIPFGGNVITDDIKEGCAIMRKPAEMLKQKFGSALASESQDNEIVCIPSIRGREPKEISVKNLASIIQARMEEIVEQVYYEIKNSGYERKLQGGIVVTGGGAQLKHICQLFEYITGLDTRVGYPNEHLANSATIENLASPMYATGIGLVIKGFHKLDTAAMRNTSQQVTKKNKTKEIKSHSEKTKGRFFDKLFTDALGWFEEKDENN